MNYLALVNRTKKESPHAGGALLSIASAVGQTAKMVDWVADAWNEIQLEVNFRNWKWMRAQAIGDVTVVGGMSYTIDQLLGVSAGTTRFRRWQVETEEYRPTAYLASNPSSEWRMYFMGYEQFSMQYLRGTHTPGAPQYWTIAPSGAVIFGPTPDQSYKVRLDYWKSNQQLTLDTDVPECPADFHMVIVWKALNDSGAVDAAPETVARAADHYDAMMTRLMADQAQSITIEARPLGG